MIEDWMQRLVLVAGALAVSTLSTQAGAPPLERATFAGGCFWCVQPAFERLTGVVSVAAGYIGAKGPAPTYENYAQLGYIEAVQIVFDPSKISYPQLLDVFWRQVDPTDGGGQFVDRGPQYRPVIFYHSPAQKKAAEMSKNQLDKSGRYDKPIATELLAADVFYPAETYHQDYYKKEPAAYQRYRTGAGRDRFLERIWGRKGDKKVPATESAKPAKPEKEILN